MDRRTVLKTGSMGLLGIGLGGCATNRPARTSPARARVNLPPVIASWDRVIRTTVGLRPHRTSGFRLGAEKLDAKTVIHNYGHGGSGHSLGWGTGYLAAELAMAHQDRRAAVLGCGTVGLTAARQLQRRGFDVTIYTLSVPPDTTSNMAWAAFTPTSGLISGERPAEWDGQFSRAVEIAYRQLQLLAGPNYGISWIDGYTMTNELPGSGGGQGGAGTPNPPLPPAPRAGQIVLQPGEHPFPTKYATCRPNMRIEPSIYLDALVRDFLLFGGRIVIRKFDTPRDLMSLDESLIINSTGLGSRALFNDEHMMPVKGQLTVLVPQAEVNYSVSTGARSDGRRGMSAMSRRDGIVIGGTAERGVWTLEPNDELRRELVDDAIQVFGAMRPMDPSARVTRLQAPQAPPTAESFFDLES
jgi:D-amino-acid oxidase